MKRNLLSSAIIVAIMALGLTGCDDKKAETETPPPANSQPAAPDKYQQGSDYQKAYLTYDSVDFKRVVLFVHLSVNQLLKSPLTVYLEHIGGDFLCITAFRAGRSVSGRGFFRRVKLDCYIALGV